MSIAPETKERIPRDLKPGEWQLFCNHCGFKYPKDTAAKSVCPDCGERLYIASEKGVKVGA